MNSKEMRIVYLPTVTDVFVAEDGKNFLRIVNEIYQEQEDCSCVISVVPGVSKIKFMAVSDGVEHYYWTYSDDIANDGIPIGDGSDMNVCMLSIPNDISDGTIIYVEEGNKEVDFGYDIRDLYFKNYRAVNPLGDGIFSVRNETISGR